MVKPDSKLKRISTEIHVCVYVCTRNEDNVDYSALKLAMDGFYDLPISFCVLFSVKCHDYSPTAHPVFKYDTKTSLAILVSDEILKVHVA